MKREDISEAVGNISTKHIQEAVPGKRANKKPVWFKWGAIAACFALVAVICIPLLTPPEEPSAGDLAPMIFVNDTLYYQVSNQKSFTEKQDGFVYIGKIESEVLPSQIPNEELQANDGIVGAEVYQYGEDIVVLINGQYWIYNPSGQGTVEYDGVTYNKSDLSLETLQWLVWYNSLSKEEQQAVNYIPTELIGDSRSISADETDSIDFHGVSYSKQSLSEETVQWLEWYNSLTSEEQLAVNSIPAELIKEKQDLRVEDADSK